MEPGTKIAVISKSGEGVTHVAPSEKTPSKASPEPSPEKEAVDKPQPKAETRPPKEKPKVPSPPPPKPSATEPVLPPKERERRVSIMNLNIYYNTPVILSVSSSVKLLYFNSCKWGHDGGLGGWVVCLLINADPGATIFWCLFLLQVPMTRLRKRVATRLKDSQNTFAMLTTFNEVDM